MKREVSFTQVLSISVAVLFNLVVCDPTSASPATQPTTMSKSSKMSKNKLTKGMHKPTTVPASRPSKARKHLSSQTSQPSTKPTSRKVVKEYPLLPFLKGKNALQPKTLDALIRGVESIQLRNPRSKDFVQLLQVGGVWKITFPLIFPADKEVVRRFFATLFQYKYRSVHKPMSTSVSAKDLKPYQLAQPPYHLMLKYRGKMYHITLSKKPKVKKKFYVYVYGGPGVLQVGRTLWYALDKTLYDWKSKHVFPTSTQGLTRIQMGCGNRHVLFQAVYPAKMKRVKNARWKALEFPKVAFKSSYRIQRMVTMMGYLRFNQFISHAGKRDANRFGLRIPECVLQLNWQNGKSEFYSFRKKDKYSYYIQPSHLNIVGLISEFFLNEMKQVLHTYHPQKPKIEGKK